MRVLCQVTWPQSTAFKANSDNFVGVFSEKIAEEYPSYSAPQGGGLALTFGPAQPIALNNEMIHQFATWDGEWKVSLTNQFLALETSNYSDRLDFLARLRRVLFALDSALPIKYTQRIGFRYTNRLDGIRSQSLTELVDTALLGASALAPKGSTVHHNYSECLYELEDTKLLARWAFLPPGGSIDPTIEPINEATWVLDLDAFSESRLPFSPAGIALVADSLAESGYQFFRRSTTDQFVKAFGGSA